MNEIKIFEPILDVSVFLSSKENLNKFNNINLYSNGAIEYYTTSLIKNAIDLIKLKSEDNNSLDKKQIKIIKFDFDLEELERNFNKNSEIEIKRKQVKHVARDVGMIALAVTLLFGMSLLVGSVIVICGAAPIFGIVGAAALILLSSLASIKDGITLVRTWKNELVDIRQDVYKNNKGIINTTILTLEDLNIDLQELYEIASNKENQNYFKNRLGALKGLKENLLSKNNPILIATQINGIIFEMEQMRLGYQTLCDLEKLLKPAVTHEKLATFKVVEDLSNTNSTKENLKPLHTETHNPNAYLKQSTLDLNHNQTRAYFV